MAEHAVLFEHRQQRQLFKKQQDREPQSPQHERPRRPVPQAVASQTIRMFNS